MSHHSILAQSYLYFKIAFLRQQRHLAIVVGTLKNLIFIYGIGAMPTMLCIVHSSGGPLPVVANVVGGNVIPLAEQL
jgi:hypothetical protein